MLPERRTRSCTTEPCSISNQRVFRDAPVAGRQRHRLAAERLGEPKRVGDAVAFFFRKLRCAPSFDIKRRPRPVQPVGEPLGVANKSGAAPVFADADQNALAGGPGSRDGMRLHVCEQLLVNAVRRAAQRKLAQSGQVAGREIMLQGPLGLLGDVDFALLEPLDQIVGGDVDELDCIGAVEHRIRYGLAHLHMRDLGDHIVETLDVLDVDRTIDVDSVVEQFLNIQIALGMPAARRVGMGELVHKNDLRMPRDDGIEIHLLEPLPLVFNVAAGNDFEPFQQSLGFLAAVGFHDADRHVIAVEFAGARLLQHLVGLAYSGCGPDEYLEPASRALFAPGGFEQGLGGRSLVRVAALIRHQDSLLVGCSAIERQIERKNVHPRLA